MATKNKPSILGENVLILRRRAGLTQQQLADACGLQVNTIARLEQGAVQDLRGQHIAAIASVLRTTPNDLLGVETNRANGRAPRKAKVKRVRAESI